MEHARLSQMSSHSASPSPNQDKVIDRSGLHRLFLCKIFKSVGQFSEQIAEDYGSYLFNEAENWDTVRHCLMLRLYLPRLPDSSSLHIIFVSKPETWDLARKLRKMFRWAGLRSIINQWWSHQSGVSAVTSPDKLSLSDWLWVLEHV